jgi:hypothetical protein
VASYETSFTLVCADLCVGGMGVISMAFPAKQCPFTYRGRAPNQMRPGVRTQLRDGPLYADDDQR